MDRRKFLRNNSLIIAGLGLAPFGTIANITNKDRVYTSMRPAVNKRSFVSDEVENTIAEIKSNIVDKEIAWMFENCYPNTLDTTVDYEIIDGKPDTFIITGDIDAMWLRDSTAQVWPYMPMINKDKKIKNLIAGLVNRQVKCVLTDPYANAFYKDLNKVSHWAGDFPSPKNGVHERKWEIDSLCYVVRLSQKYYELSGDKSIFDKNWDKAMRLIVKTLRTEQRKDGTTPYRFRRNTSAMIDAPLFDGTSRPIKPTGMICSAFRPSDDATMYPYLIPSNIFAVQSLIELSNIYLKVIRDEKFSVVCNDFAMEVKEGINKYAIGTHLNFGEIYAYEVDGFGNKNFMDDANVPSLMSLEYLGAHKAYEPIYKNTREFLISDSNPYYLRGTAAEGQASPHTGKDKIWPMGITLRAMTSVDKNEIKFCLKQLRATHGGTGFMHEAFHKDNPKDFNREWFAWANTLFGELIIKISNEHPEILLENFE